MLRAVSLPRNLTASRRPPPPAPFRCRSRRVRAYLCSQEGSSNGSGEGDAGSGASGSSGSKDGLFVGWLTEPPRQAGGGERGTKKAAAQAAAQEEQERKVMGGKGRGTRGCYRFQKEGGGGVIRFSCLVRFDGESLSRRRAYRKST